MLAYRCSLSHHLPRILLWGTIVSLAFAPQAALAQGGEEAPQNQAATEDEEPAPSIMKMVVESGPTGWGFMFVLGAFSVYATMVAVERYSATKNHVLIPPKFVEELQAKVVGRDATPTELRDLCARYDGPPTNILSAGLLRTGRPLPEVEKAMEDAAAREMAELRSRVRPLSVIGSIAPLVGLLGTVVGMIGAFYTASAGGLGGEGETLAQGIYLALLTTAAGLAIAIPCLLLAAFYNAKIDRAFREMDMHLTEALSSFGAMENTSREFASEDKETADQRLLATAK